MFQRVIYGLIGVLFGVLAGVANGEPITHGVAWTWVDRNGTVNYTDEVRRIPLAYLQVAREVKLEPLVTYRKYTPVEDRPRRRCTPIRDDGEVCF